MVKFGALAFGLLAAVAQVSAQQTVKVMPFGASIVSRCWRANLQAKLRNDKTTNFDFVGSKTGTCEGTGIDQDHEGHPGSQATDYAKNGNLTVWLNANPPDVIVMLLGTNDVLLGKKPTGEIIKAYDVLVGQMRAKNPKMYIIISNLLPLDPKRWPQTAADGIVNLNTAIRQWVPSKNTRDSPVIFVDNFSNFDYVADTTDGEHPNAAGNEKMATKFFTPLKNAIKAIAPGDNQSDTAVNPGSPGPADPSAQSSTQSQSAASTKASAQAQTATLIAVTSHQSTAILSKATSSVSSDAKPTSTASTTPTPSPANQQTSSATSLRIPWPLHGWGSFLYAAALGNSHQGVLRR